MRKKSITNHRAAADVMKRKTKTTGIHDPGAHRAAALRRWTRNASGRSLPRADARRIAALVASPPWTKKNSAKSPQKEAGRPIVVVVDSRQWKKTSNEKLPPAEAARATAAGAGATNRKKATRKKAMMLLAAGAAAALLRWIGNNDARSLRVEVVPAGMSSHPHRTK